MSEPDGPTVSVGQLKQLFGLETDRRIQQLADEGVIVRAKHGRYDLLRSIVGYVKYLKDRAMRADVSSDNFTQQRARRAKALADREERENEVSAGALIPVEEALSVWGAIVTTFTTKVRGIGAKVAPLLEGMNVAERKAAIDEAADECLSELAQAEVVFDPPAVPAPAGNAAPGDEAPAAGEPAAETDGEPVG